LKKHLSYSNQIADTTYAEQDRATLESDLSGSATLRARLPVCSWRPERASVQVGYLP